MSFLVDDRYFDQFQDLIDYITEQLAVWNNFEVEQGKDVKVFTIVKPPLTNTLGVHVNDQAKASDHLR